MDAETRRAIEALADTLSKAKAIADSFASEYIDTLDIDATAMMILADREHYESLYNVMGELLFSAYKQAKQLAEGSAA